MRNILSAIIIDKDYEAHNYKEVKMKNVPNWYESNFEIKRKRILGSWSRL